MLILQCGAAGGNSLSYFTAQPQSDRLCANSVTQTETVRRDNKGFVLPEKRYTHMYYVGDPHISANGPLGQHLFYEFPFICHLSYLFKKKYKQVILHWTGLTIKMMLKTL